MTHKISRMSQFQAQIKARNKGNYEQIKQVNQNPGNQSFQDQVSRNWNTLHNHYPEQLASH